MFTVKEVRDYNYNKFRKLNFYCLVDEIGIPVFEPSMFLFSEAIRGASENTTRGYANDLRSFFNMLKKSYGETCQYDDVTDKQMNGYLNGYLHQERKLKPSTIVRHVTTIKSFYNFCYSNGFTSKKPIFSFSYADDISTETMMAGMTTQLHRTYMDENAFNDVILGHLTTQDPFLKERDELALKLGYYAGFRTHELVAYGNLNAEKLRELLPRQDRRTVQSIELPIKGKGKKRRMARLPIEMTQALYDFIWGRARGINGSIMCKKDGEPLSNSSHGTQLFAECKSNYLAKTTLTKGEFERWGERSYHLLRACYATNMVSFCVDEGLDPRVFVTQWMGHSDPSTTDIYIFYDAVLNKRLKIIQEMSLNNTFFGKTFRETFKKGSLQ